MGKRKMNVIVAVVMAVLAMPTTVLAQDKYALNTQAYKGLMFGQIFGTVPDPIAEPSLTADGNCPSASCDEQGAISLGAFVERVSANLQRCNPRNAEDTALVGNVRDRVTALMAYLDQNDTPESGCLKTWPLRWFFEEDLESKVFDSQARQTTVQALFRDHFKPLEEAGLTLPWLLVARRATHIEFFDLLYGTRFLQRCAKMTYEDFFSIGIDNPLVDDELMELAQRAIQAGLFGAFHVYRDNPMASVNLSELADSVGPLVSYMCCDRLNRTCGVSMSIGSFCNMCGRFCCIGSTWCP
jgi:hypothetical protein